MKYSNTINKRTLFSRTLGSLFFALIPLTGFSQSDSMFSNQAEKKFQKVQQEIQSRGAQVKDEESGPFFEFQRWSSIWRSRVSPHGNLNAVGAVKANRQCDLGPVTGSQPWNEVGPATDDPQFGNGLLGIGLVNFIRFSPVYPDRVFTGSWHSGLFVSEDGGNSWQQAGTDTQLPTLGVADVAMDPTPSGDGTWFIASGAGEGYFKTSKSMSTGIYRTIDAGGAWVNIADRIEIKGNYWSWQIYRLLYNENGGVVEELIAATSSGIWRTTDPLISDPSWTRLFPNDDGNHSTPFDFDCLTDYNIPDRRKYFEVYDVEYVPETGHSQTDPCTSCQTLYATVGIRDGGCPDLTCDLNQDNDVNGSNDQKCVYIIRSTDGGNSWSRVPVDVSLTGTTDDVLDHMEDSRRADLEISPADPSQVYVSFERRGGMSDPDKDNLYRFHLNGSGDFEWGRLDDNKKWAFHLENVSAFAASPADAGLVVRSDGISALRFPYPANICSPCSWKVESGTGAYHVDIRDIRFDPSGDHLWLATDGGVYKAQYDANASPANSFSGWETLNEGLGVSYVDDMAHSDKNPEAMLMGLWHDGTVRTEGGHDLPWAPQWSTIWGADGQRPMVEHEDPSNVYYTAQGAPYEFSSQYGDNGTNINVSEHPDFSNVFNVTATMSPVDERVTFNPGKGGNTGKLMRVTKNGDGLSTSDFTKEIIAEFEPTNTTYFPVGVLDDPNNNILIVTQVYPAPEDEDVLYVNVVEIDPFSEEWKNILIFKTDQAMADAATVRNNWEMVQTPSNVADDRNVNDIAVGHDDPDNIHVAFGGLHVPWGQPSTFRKVYRYDGTDWTNMSGDLCNVNCTAIAKERGSNGNLYLGTDNGMFFTNKDLLDGSGSGAPQWKRYGGNFPHAEVKDLLIHYESNTIRAGTVGRGLWENGLLCPQDQNLSLSGAQNSDDFFEVTEVITSDQTVGTDNKVTYRAGDREEFKPGFHAAPSSDGRVHAFIHPCVEGDNSFESLVLHGGGGSREGEEDPVELRTNPNPHDGQFMVSILDDERAEETSTDISSEKNDHPSITIIVTDVMGRQVFREDGIQKKDIRVDLSRQPDGLYLVKVIRGDETGVEKVLKE